MSLWNQDCLGFNPGSATSWLCDLGTSDLTSLGLNCLIYKMSMILTTDEVVVKIKLVNVHRKPGTLSGTH